MDEDEFIFANPRVCNFCYEPRQDRLTDCQCNCVSYCSQRCTKADKHHKKECSTLVTAAHNRCLYFMHISYPLSLQYALQQLGNQPVGQTNLPLKEVKSLNVHIVTQMELPGPELVWEIGFMDLLPNLKTLNLNYIIQGSCSDSVDQASAYITSTTCGSRVISYSVQKMFYHMFFSSPMYTEPDVVVVYGNSYEMLNNEEGDIHSEISYRNMTYSRDTVLVLTDSTEDLVKKGVRAVNAVRPVVASDQSNCDYFRPQNSHF